MDGKFKDNLSSRTELLRQIQQVEFALVDLNLYLDNHPTNKKAIEDFNEFQEEYMKLKKEYETRFRMFANFGNSKADPSWSWVDEPWPWERGE
ncbi:spore coat protein CotJB [Clostridium sp.]|jgi:spore coat protein JB|uniref:spore coat protein CotJB n=1 Tax=Clostridium sp. TaxID=1506 RepID=UPI0039F47E18